MVLPRLSLLHYLISYSEGEHVAHCLDIDTVATSPIGERDAIDALNVLVKAHIEHAAQYDPASLLIPAPQEYWARFANAIFGGFERITISLPEKTQQLPSQTAPLINVLAGQHATH